MIFEYKKQTDEKIIEKGKEAIAGDKPWNELYQKMKDKFEELDNTDLKGKSVVETSEILQKTNELKLKMDKLEEYAGKEGKHVQGMVTVWDKENREWNELTSDVARKMKERQKNEETKKEELRSEGEQIAKKDPVWSSIYEKLTQKYEKLRGKDTSEMSIAELSKSAEEYLNTREKRNKFLEYVGKEKERGEGFVTIWNEKDGKWEEVTASLAKKIKERREAEKI